MKKNAVLLIFFLALLLRALWFFVVFVKNPAGFMLYDSWGYWKIAENIEKYGIFSQHDNLFPDSTRTPFYPFFILLLKKAGFYTIIVAQILISSATCTLTAVLSENFFQNKKAGLISGILLAADFPSIFFANTLMSETMFSFLLLISFCYFVLSLKNYEKKYLILFAVLLGGAILCRPVALYLPIIFSATIFFQKAQKIQKVKNLFFFLFIVCLVIAPWVFRNYKTFGKPFLSTISETTLLFYSASAIRAETENKPIFQIQDEYMKLVQKNYDWNKPEETVRFAAFCREESFRIIKENPVLFLKNYAVSVFYFFAKPLRNYIDVQLGFASKYNSAKSFSDIEKTSIPTLLLVTFQMILILIFSACLIIFLLIKIKAFFFRHNHFNQANLVVLVILYFAVFSCIGEVDARMRIPVVPFLCIVAGSVISDFTNKNILTKHKK